jgi:predicted acylesterase/phospholipase RssA
MSVEAMVIQTGQAKTLSLRGPQVAYKPDGQGGAGGPAYLESPAIDRIATLGPGAANPPDDQLADAADLFRLSANQPDETHFTMAVVSAGTLRPIDAFARQLTSILRTFGPTLSLRKDFFRDVCNGSSPDIAADGEFGRLLSHLEHAHRFVVYECEDRPSEWTRLCLRRANRIVFVGQGDASPELNTIEAELANSRSVGAITILVLERSAGSAPMNTAQWLAPRCPKSVHNVRHRHHGDLERVARDLTGRAVGVVLSGGGARSLAHIGVIRALGEAGIPIDLIGGTSIGALIGALFAMGHDHRAVLEIADEAFVRRGLHPRWDYTLPLVSLYNGRSAGRVLRATFGDTRIEDLWLPYFCVSSNLTRARCEVHRSGPLRQWLRATAGLPGFVPPFPADGDWLVDGALLNNLPTDVGRQLGARTLIAVDATANEDFRADTGPFDVVSGWHLLWNRLTRRRARASAPPTMLQTFARAAMLGSISRREVARRSADLCLCPPVDEFGLLEWRSIDHIVATAYHDAVTRIAAWQAGRRDEWSMNGISI